MFHSGSDWVEYKQVGPSQGHINLLFFGFGSGRGKILWGIRGQGAKNLAPQDSYSFDMDFFPFCITYYLILHTRWKHMKLEDERIFRLGCNCTPGTIAYLKAWL